MDALGWLIFLAALVVSVMLHETGHFVTAKRFGMKCTQYFFGFGPTLWSVKRGETEYGFKAIPAGGFVKIVGMTAAMLAAGVAIYVGGRRRARRAALSVAAITADSLKSY